MQHEDSNKKNQFYSEINDGQELKQALFVL